MTEYNTKPATVTTAVGSFYAAIIILLVMIIAVCFKEPNVSIQILLLLTPYLIFNFFFIHKISKGRNWARIVYLILYILSIPGSLLFYYITFSELKETQLSEIKESGAWYPIITLIIYTILYLIGFIQLFQSKSNEWFKQQNN